MLTRIRLAVFVFNAFPISPGWRFISTPGLLISARIILFSFMIEKEPEAIEIALEAMNARGYIVPLGPVNLVFAVTESGMVGCGAFDVLILDKFSCAAARVRAVDGAPISSIGDLLAATVSQANTTATGRGVRPGMTGKEALARL